VTASNVGPPPINWIVGTGQCLHASNVLDLVAFTYGNFTANAQDMTICLTPTNPSSFAPPSPGYLRCDEALSALTPYEPHGVPAGCGVVNPFFAPKKADCDPIVATEDRSGGALKASY
jgi:hypothetical protein